MKNTFRLISAAFAASLALVSCDKENIIDNGTNNENGARVIAVDFAKTKSTLGTDGFTPSFAAGDMIKVSNGSAAEECAVSVNGDIATITTTLSGALDAVYPASAAKMNGNAIDGIVVPSTQDGTFASANICKATIADKATSATFQNQTAVFRFYVDASIGVKSITMVSTSDIATGSKTITITHDGTTTLDHFTDGPDKRLCYAAILADVNAGTITFTSATTTQGNVTRPKPMANVTLAAGTMYNALIPYYIDLGTAGKWAYCNLGCFLPEEFTNDYYMWGAVEKAYTSFTKTGFDGSGHFTFSTSKPGSYVNSTWDASKGFYWENAQYTDGVYTDSNKKVFTKYTGNQSAYAKSGVSDGKTVLELSDDIAYTTWGGCWRLPTKDEAAALAALSSRKYNYNYDSTGSIARNTWSFGNAPAILYLPCPGYPGASGSNLYLFSIGTSGRYWTSTLGTKPTTAYSCYFGPVGFYASEHNRYYGGSIRAVSD